MASATGLVALMLVVWAGSGCGSPLLTSSPTGDTASTPSSPTSAYGSAQSPTACCDNQTVSAVDSTAGQVTDPTPARVSFLSQVDHHIAVRMESADVSRYSDGQRIVSLIMLAYVSTLCVFAIIGIVGVAVTGCCPKSQSSTGRQAGYQILD